MMSKLRVKSIAALGLVLCAAACTKPTQSSGTATAPASIAAIAAETEPALCAPESADLSANRVTESENAAPAGVRFTVDGIDSAGNVHEGLGDVTWTLGGHRKPFTSDHVEAALHIAGGEVRNALDWIEVDAAHSTLRLRRERLAAFVSTIREARQATLVLSMSTADYSDVYTFSEELVFTTTCAPRGCTCQHFTRGSTRGE